MTQYTESFRVFDTYASKLTQREVNQLKSANATSCALITDIIRPMLYNSDSYVSLSEDKQRSRGGRYSHELSLQTNDDDFSVFQFFTNPLMNVAEDDPLYRRPSKRVILGHHAILTFEFDSTDIAFFQHQLAWLRCVKKPSDAPIGRFLADVRARFADCRGLNVTYSGGKSLHLHFVFSTTDVAAHGPFTSPRNGLIQAWQRLLPIIQQSPALNIPPAIKPDASIRFPDSFRRIPLGLRVNDKDDHLFGVPKGALIPQCVLWESIYDRSAKGCASQSIFDPADFMMAVIPAAKRRKVNLASPGSILSDSPLLKHLTRSIKHYYPDGSYPQFSHYGENQGQIAAYFSNSPTDLTPDSLIKQDYSKVFLVGTDSDLADNDRSLPRTLGEMIEEWTGDYDTLMVTDRMRTSDEQAFADRAIDHATAITAIGDILRDRIGRAGNFWITAPEGISKSRSLFNATAAAINALTEYGLPAATMYAFATYDLAREKCAEYRLTLKNQHSRTPIKAIVLRSFSAVYREACAKMALTPLTIGDAVQKGFNSLYEAIQNDQPTVMAEIHRYFRRKRHLLTVTGATPVIFTVHDVAHDWHKNTYTRRLFSAAFWSPNQANTFNRCREDTHLGILIHDEVTTADLITMVPATTRAWIDQLRADGSIWTSSTASLLDRWNSYDALSRTAKAPISYDEACKLTAINQWDHDLTTSYSGEYGDPREDDIYAATSGSGWSIKKADWFKTARTTIVLTTEAVPTHLARFIGDPWEIIELDTPLLAKGSVRTTIHDRLTGDKLAKVVADEQATFAATNTRPLLAISNRAKGVSNTTTHKTAKGSNAFIGQPVLQTMTMMAPAQYEIGEVLNALTGRTDMVLLAHLDEFQQSAGRNLGFRYRAGAEHHLVINRRLYLLLAPRVLAQSRYEMRPLLSDHDRRTASKKRGKASPALTALRSKLSTSRTKEQ